MRTIAVINQKGGVGKTTTVASLGAAIASAGRDVCVIDLDPQAHLTLSLGVEPGTPKAGIYEVLTTSTPIDQASVQVAEHLWLVPSVIDLAAAEVELVGAVGREQILRDQLLAMSQKRDYVMIDCPPSLGLLTLNALAAADDVIIPLQPHFLALQGLGKLLETISLVQRRINTGLRVRGVILCMYESATKLAAEVVADLRNFFDSARNTNVPWADAIIFESSIRRNIKLAECPSYGKTIFDYEPKSNGACDYKTLSQEFFRMYDSAGLMPAPVAPAAPISPAEHQQQVLMPVHVPQAQASLPPIAPAHESVAEVIADHESQIAN
ncbi:MAG: ParA family protein [Planctomycetaceae bacterium]|nr:MAG: ParA family protein [Planctomycetaceae bacterium]